jgi:cytidine deaminase
VLAEFCSADLTVLLGTPDHFSVHTLGELLPFSFTASEL